MLIRRLLCKLGIHTYTYVGSDAWCRPLHMCEECGKCLNTFNRKDPRNYR